MELIRISDSKIKIMLNAEDMAHYAITSELLNYENTETRRVVWQILDEAKQKTGFGAASDRVLIQVYPSRSGGCEMYVTKVPPSLPHPAEERGAPRHEGKRALYAFSCLSDFLHACRQLSCREGVLESTAYVTQEGSYYLLIEEGGAESLPGFAPVYSPAEEYGERMKNSGARLAYIKEHATCLCENGAVERFASL